jgi:hypothetical protein
LLDLVQLCPLCGIRLAINPLEDLFREHQQSAKRFPLDTLLLLLSVPWTHVWMALAHVATERLSLGEEFFVQADMAHVDLLLRLIDSFRALYDPLCLRLRKAP